MQGKIWAFECTPILEVLAKSSTWVVGGRTLGCSWEDVDTTWRCTASRQQLWMSATISMLYFLGAKLEWEALFHGLRGYLTWIPLVIFYGDIWSHFCFEIPVETGIELITGIVAACQWCYSNHTRNICQGAAESCTPMSCLHWDWWPSIWAAVVRCKMVR